MQTKIILLVSAFFITVMGTSQEKSRYSPQLDTVVKMFSKKDASVIAPVMAENYTIAGILPGLEEQVLPQVLTQLPKFDKYTIKSETQEKGGTRIQMAFFLGNTGTDINSNFLINAEGKIQELNILEDAAIQTKTGK